MRSVAFAAVASLQLPPDHAAASRARHFVCDTLRAWGCDDAIPDAELLVSELVTNAVLHARSATRVTIERDGERNGSVLRFSVYDASPTRPRLRDYGPQAVTGRGLLLVDRIARRWGVDPQDAGKCVWFEVESRARVG
jgi:anti-sigma regulatory factor (Ser/Thr protein kinase)